ncbi:hypothetical protein R5W23_000689 [Gemmata sp. JC673]|uniref:Uncharacterized protein n=1 Tax=Gemmata algarum TaxID=2975278 RepID=A0ABU5F170_9BACT|nr:hypothetical protein [Gemmata algarum]MDY3559676.1 hypothetical protein [Gemmata algarum]
MSAHRFLEHFPHAAPVSPVMMAAPSCAFVPCPVFAAMPAGQQAHVQAIYQLAAERTREHLRRRRPWPPLFSAN